MNCCLYCTAILANSRRNERNYIKTKASYMLSKTNVVIPKLGKKRSETNWFYPKTWQNRRETNLVIPTLGNKESYEALPNIENETNGITPDFLNQFDNYCVKNQLKNEWLRY